MDNKCPMCKIRFRACPQTRLLKETISSLEIKCRGCENTFEFKDKEQHLHDLKVEKCPFECTDFVPCHPDQLDDHVIKNCTGK